MVSDRHVKLNNDKIALVNELETERKASMELKEKYESLSPIHQNPENAPRNKAPLELSLKTDHENSQKTDEKDKENQAESALVESLSEEVQRLREELKEISAEKNTVQNENELMLNQLKTDIANLKTENDFLKSNKVNELKSPQFGLEEMKVVQKEIDNLRERYAKDLQSVKAANADLTKVFQQELDAAKATCRDLSMKLAEALKQKESDSSSSNHPSTSELKNSISSMDNSKISETTTSSSSDEVRRLLEEIQRLRKSEATLKLEYQKEKHLTALLSSELETVPDYIVVVRISFFYYNLLFKDFS